MESTQRPVIPRWEPHEAHCFTKPYSRRSGKPEWLEEAKPTEPVKAERKSAGRSNGNGTAQWKRNAPSGIEQNRNGKAQLGYAVEKQGRDMQWK